MVIKVTSGHLKLAVLLIWIIVGLPTVIWLAVHQYLPDVTYNQVFLPFLALYSLIYTEEVIRAALQQEKKLNEQPHTVNPNHGS